MRVSWSSRIELQNMLKMVCSQMLRFDTTGLRSGPALDSLLGKL